MYLYGKKLLFVIVFSLSLLVPSVLANTYIADLSLTTSQTVYTINEMVELKGFLYLSNYSNNGTLLQNHTGLANSSINISFINKNTSLTLSSYTLNTSTGGKFYSRSNYYSTAPLVSAPSTTGDYFIRANYTDPNGTTWWTQTEIQVVNQSVNKLKVSSEKVSYNPSDGMTIKAEAIRQLGDRIVYIANVSINGSIRNSAKSVLSNFSCTTGASGKCTVTATAPSSYGDYLIEVNNFKAFSSFEVIRFEVTIEMKDELGKSIKHTFNTGEQASVEVGAITNSTSEAYTFDGLVKDSSGNVVKMIDSTSLIYNDSYTNRFTFTLDALNFSAGTYLVYVNVTKTGDGIVEATTSFQVRSWSLQFKKKDVDSGFEYEYSTFSNKTINMEIYPTWRANGSVISSINTTTSINISLTDTMNNRLATANSTWNASCGTEGCYEFSLTTPANAGKYYVSVIVSHNGEAQTRRKKINVVSASIFAQSTDKDGTLKDLFGTNEYTYISLSAKNATADVNLSNASIVAVIYMNGSEYNYSKVGSFSLVNASNNKLEWAWNFSSQRLKLDTPKAGGIYTIYITANNDTVATSTKFIVNPYDVCLVAKNTAGQAGGSTGYYYAYQFKTSDTVYFEFKITQANNPTGRASVLNASGNSSGYGMGSECVDQSSTKQVVNNATITIEQVINTQTGKAFPLNSSESSCQVDDDKGKYTCTVKPIGRWDGGSYGIKFKMVGQDGQTSDFVFGGFEARAFYLYAYPSNWRNKPTSNISLTVDMYEAGSNWWGNYGSGGLSGTVTVKKIEYQGRDGEWIWPPIEYDYNVSKVNTSTISNGRGTLTLPASNNPDGQWKTGYYRAILQGTDNAGNNDYGYAWFGIKMWEVYASPVECWGTSCTSVYYLNSKSNITLYVTINNAGEWGQSGNDLGGNVAIGIKKLQDCRKWPCSDLNSSKYNATNITVTKSSGWYWSGNINSSYLINITPNSGTWGTGYWQVVLDVNGTETGSGWFNTIAFYVEIQPTDSNGTNWKYSIKNNETMYFKVTTVKSQKSGYYYGNYNTSDYVNTTIDSAVLRRWDQTAYNSIEYNYPTDINISIVGGGSVINGTKVVNVTYANGSWPSGYYNGELSLKNSGNETSTSYIWFQVRPFRVSVSSNQYEIDKDACVNGTIYIYEPDWSSNTILNGTYNISSVTERVWTMSGSSLTTYTNYTPSGSFNGTSNFSICPDGAKWGSGSWGNYHYLTIKVKGSSGEAEEGWLSFRTIPFSITWGNIVGGTSVPKTSSITVPVNLSKAIGGASTYGNLTSVYQWRSDYYGSSREEYTFLVGSCNSSTSTGGCMVNGSQNVTIYAPNGGWVIGYNYLQAEWTESDDATSRVEDYSNLWFDGKEAYTGWWENSDENGYYKYYFGDYENLTIRLYVLDSSFSNAVTVNVTAVEYLESGTSTWQEANYNVSNQTDNEINGSGIIKLIKPSGNWTKGYIYTRATVSGENGTAVITGGTLYVKDTNAPTVNVTTPLMNETVNASPFLISWTTDEPATCYFYILNYDTYHTWYCSNWNSSNNTNASVSSAWSDSCNSSKYDFNGSIYNYHYIAQNYHSWNLGDDYGWRSESTGLVTGGTSHYYSFDLDSYTLINQDYGINIWCTDSCWNYNRGSTAFNLNYSSATLNVTLHAPLNNSNWPSAVVNLNYSFLGANSANCSLYGNFSGNWSVNESSSYVNNASVSSFNVSLTNGTYLWNTYCVDITDSSNNDWGDHNWTFAVSTGEDSSPSVSLVSPADDNTSSSSNVTFNCSATDDSGLVNITLYGNWSGSWRANQTANLTGSSDSSTFNATFSDGKYKWNCLAYDNASQSAFAGANRTFVVALSSNTTSSVVFNVTLLAPADNLNLTSNSVVFNYSFTGPSGANCSLYGNYSGNWSVNESSANVSNATVSSFNVSLPNGTYLWNVYCVDTSNSSNADWADNNWTFSVNTTNASSSASVQINVTLLKPFDASTLNASDVTLNYSFTGPNTANCSLYANFTGGYVLNQTSTYVNNVTINSFNVSLSNGAYTWNTYCVDTSNSSNYDWGQGNWTFTVNTVGNNSPNVTLVYPTDNLTINLSIVTFNYTLSGPDYANCSLYGNNTGNWSLNTTITNLTAGNQNFSSIWINGAYVWNVYCVDYTNTSESDWADQNWTFVNIYTG